MILETLVSSSFSANSLIFSHQNYAIFSPSTPSILTSNLLSIELLF
jgi:hypothetical protein